MISLLPIPILAVASINISWLVRLPSSVRHAVEEGLGSRYLGVVVIAFFGSIFWLNMIFVLVWWVSLIEFPIDYISWTDVDVTVELDQCLPMSQRVPSQLDWIICDFLLDIFFYGIMCSIMDSVSGGDSMASRYVNVLISELRINAQCTYPFLSPGRVAK